MRIAYITSRFPFPIEKGDKLRAFEHIRSLGAVHEVHLLSLSHSPVGHHQLQALAEHCASVEVFSLPRMLVPFFTASTVLAGLPIQVGLFWNPSVKRKMQDRIVKLQPDVLVSQLIRTSEYVRGLPVPKILDYMDAFSVGAEQRSRSGNFLLRPFYALESSLVKQYEQTIYADFDRHMIISTQDRNRLPLPFTDSVHVVPNGVDTESFHTGGARQREGVLFVGNMGYPPNIEAAEFLVRRVMPLVWKDHPDVKLTLAGARPSRRVRRLQARRVIITGWVDDIRECYAEAAVFAAPMRSGMGLQNKILEAMAMSLPCVTTPIVNNAIQAGRGDEILIANSAVETANAISRLLNNRRERERIGTNARHFIENTFTWDVQNKKLQILITETAGKTVDANALNEV